MSKVVHCKRSRYDIYIGRPGPWGNPFEIGKDGTREEVIQKYETWLTSSPEAAHLRKKLPSLHGKILGCWCKPHPCHGDVILKLLETL